jgi:MFS family permease
MQTTKQRPASLWHNHNYLLLWSGQLISATGTQVAQLAFPLLVLLLTHSPAQAGIVGALRSLPYLVFSLPAGALLDRWDRKRVMILCDAGRALCLASIPCAFALGWLSLAQIYVVSLLEGTLFVFFDIAETACLPNIVAREHLPAAVAQNQATFGITSLLGPSLGGLLYGVNLLLPFLANAISYAASVLSLFWVKSQFQQERVAASRRLYLEMFDGLRWFWRQPLLRVMAIVSCGVNLVVVGGSTLLLIVLAQHLGASPFQIGLVFACSGMGYILGSLLTPLLQKRLSFGQAIIGNLWVLALLWPLYALMPNIIVLSILTAVIFFLGPIYNVVNSSYRLALVPDELQARVNSAVRMISFATTPLGVAATGFLIQTIGPNATALVGTGVLILMALLVTASQSVRHAPRIDEPTRYAKNGPDQEQVPPDACEVKPGYLPPSA